jgi:4-diphosphocytidyl-2-C-methyl-D-erythritol kinase
MLPAPSATQGWESFSLPAPAPMLIRRQNTGVRVTTPAKVNLFLEVLRRRADGYHDLATLMVAVSLYDTLEFAEDPSGSVRLDCDLPSLSTGPDNLVCRAVELVRRRSGLNRGVSIRLWKRIPLAAGLAGGSSDAAATLAGLNRLWQLGWDRVELMRLGAELGSDVPFFFATPAAWCTGRGEVVEPLPLGRPLDFVLACPPMGLSTAEVFRGMTVPAEPLDGTALQQAAVNGAVEELGRYMHNRLQEVAERLCPAVADLARRMTALGPAGTLMSGSGTTVVALCRNAAEALRIARALGSLALERVGTRVSIVRSCD